MPVRPHQLRPAPEGFASSVAGANLPLNRSRQLQGFWPARLGQQKVVPQFKFIPEFTGNEPPFNTTGTAIWLAADGRLDTLLSYLPSGLLFGSLLRVTDDVGNNTSTFKYDYIKNEQRAKFVLGESREIIDLAGFGAGQIFSWVQYQTELILAMDAGLYRFYRTDTSPSVYKFYKLGLPTPASVTLTEGATGSGVLKGQYEYEDTFVDEMGRESSPSVATQTSDGLVNVHITVSAESGSDAADYGGVARRIYRRNPGSATFNLVVEQTLPAAAYIDNTSDEEVSLNPTAPEAGANDIPDPATILAVHGDRLLMNNIPNPSILQISNANSATQFASIVTLDSNGIPLPDLGVRIVVGGAGSDGITGIANIGSPAAIAKRTTIFLLYGSDATNFELRQIHDGIGCANPNTFVRTPNEIVFLSREGPRILSYESGFVSDPIGIEIDDLFHDFTSPDSPPPNQDAEPYAGVYLPNTPRQPYSTEVAEAAFGDVAGGDGLGGVVSSFYLDNRYYLSIGDKTLCLDLLTKGWSDTGWGLLRTVAVYQSRYQSSVFLYDGPPLMVIATFGNLFASYPGLYYFTTVDQWNDPDAFIGPNRPYVAKEVTGNFDGNGPSQETKKRAALFVLFGTSKLQKGTKIGTLTCFSDNHQVGRYPIKVGQRVGNRYSSSLFSQALPVSMTGEELWFEMEFTDRSLVLQNRLVEYSILNSSQYGMAGGQ